MLFRKAYREGKRKKRGNKKLMLCDGRGRLGRHATVCNFLDGEEYFKKNKEKKNEQLRFSLVACKIPYSV